MLLDMLLKLLEAAHPVFPEQKTHMGFWAFRVQLQGIVENIGYLGIVILAVRTDGFYDLECPQGAIAGIRPVVHLHRPINFHRTGHLHDAFDFHRALDLLDLGPGPFGRVFRSAEFTFKESARLADQLAAADITL